MKNELEIIKQGSFTKLNLEKVKNDFDSQCEGIIKCFVITENKPANFSEILKIKEDFESIILSIKKGFNALFNYYYNNIGNITNNFEIKLFCSQLGNRAKNSIIPKKYLFEGGLYIIFES